MKPIQFSRENDPIRRTLRIDASGDLHASASQSLDDIFALNKAFHSQEAEQSTSLWKGRSMVKVASIPLALVEHWMTVTGMNPWNDPDAAAKMLTMLDSSEYQNLRTAPGKLSGFKGG